MAKAARIPRSACPVCEHAIDAAAAINEPGIYQTPNAGDTTVCIECMAWLIFRDDLSMRRMTEKEINSLHEEEREPLVELTRAIRRVHELQASRPKMR